MSQKVPLTFKIFQGGQLVRTEVLTQDVIKVGRLSSCSCRWQGEPRLLPILRRDPSLPHSVDHRLCAGADSQLVVDVGQVGLHRAHADGQLLSDVIVGESLRRASQHLQLPVRQGVCRLLGWLLLRQVAHDHGGDCRW